MRRLVLIGMMTALAGAWAVTAHAQGGRGGGGGGHFGRGEAHRGPDGEDEETEGPRRPRQQLFISPSGQPFRAPMGEPYPVAAWFAQADTNHDGKLTREEFRADADAWFKVVDTNADGQISMPEVTYWEEALVPEMGQAGGFGGPGGGGRALGRNQLDTRTSGAATYSLINEPHPLRGADADFSMKVSLAEWRAATDRRFALLDVDGDGFIALADLKPTPAQRMLEKADGKKGKSDKGRPR